MKGIKERSSLPPLTAAVVHRDVQISRVSLESDNNRNQSIFSGGQTAVARNTLHVSSRLLPSWHFTWNASEGFCIQNNNDFG